MLRLEVEYRSTKKTMMIKRLCSIVNPVKLFPKVDTSLENFLIKMKFSAKMGVITNTVFQRKNWFSKITVKSLNLVNQLWKVPKKINRFWASHKITLMYHLRLSRQERIRWQLLDSQQSTYKMRRNSRSSRIRQEFRMRTWKMPAETPLFTTNTSKMSYWYQKTTQFKTALSSTFMTLKTQLKRVRLSQRRKSKRKKKWNQMILPASLKLWKKPLYRTLWKPHVVNRKKFKSFNKQSRWWTCMMKRTGKSMLLWVRLRMTST